VLVLASALALVTAAAIAAHRLAGLDTLAGPALGVLLLDSYELAFTTTAVALAAWLAVFSMARRISSDPVRALLATSVPGAPLAWVGVRAVNRTLLPELGSIESVVGNLMLAVAILALWAGCARWLRVWSERFDRAPRIGLVLLLIPVSLHVADRNLRPSGPNVIVILIDVLRADELGCYGYERDTSPNIDRLAADAVLFEHAMAQSTFTKTSVASLFTGRWPHEHGVFEGSLENSEGEVVSDVLDGGMTTLAESLGAAGFLTVAWVQNEQLRAFLGFSQGFALYHDQPGQCEAILRGFLDWNDGPGRRLPYFAYLHLLDLHGPYRPPASHAERFVDLPKGYELQEWEQWIAYKKLVRKGELFPTTAEVETLRGLYDAQLAWVDEQIGALVGELRARGTYDESLIILLADHGDAFMEHGWLSHSNTPYEELIHVPLIVKLPRSRAAGRRVRGTVALTDLSATLEELLGADGIGERGDGQSFAAQLEPGAEVAPRQVLSMFKNMVAVRDGRWKLIQTFENDPELYDLETDPGETRDLSAVELEVLAKLQPVALDAIRRKLEARMEQTELSEETVQKLRELGYVD
jgi:arylsulfatase A-like enzyme